MWTPKGMEGVLGESEEGGRGISAKLNGKAKPDKWRTSSEDNQCSKWLSKGWWCLSWPWARYWCRTGKMGAVHLELWGELVAELVTLNEIYHINASTLITPVNQQAFGLSESCLLLPPKNATSSLLLINSAHAYLSSIYSGKLKLRRTLNKTCLNYAIHSGWLDRWVVGLLFKTNLREQMWWGEIACWYVFNLAASLLEQGTCSKCDMWNMDFFLESVKWEC